MEENKDLSRELTENKENEPALQPEQGAGASAPQAAGAEQGAIDTTTTESDAADDESADTADATDGVSVAAEPVADESQSVPDAPQEQTPAVRTLSWSFGSTQPGARKRDGKGAFFAIFGGVFGVCLALLIAVLFLGEGGFEIIRTLRSERVIYVRDESLATDLLTPNEAADVMKKSSVTILVTTKDGSGVGSGFVYDAKGHICTNYHVIEGATSIQVMLASGTVLDAKQVGADEISDLAVLKVDSDELVPATIGSSADLLVGDDLVAIGTPARLDLAGTATFGKVSCTERLLPLTDTETGSVYRKITVIQTDASLNPGNSGGPVADMYGRVVGIVVRKIMTYGNSTYEGLGFVIPIDGAKTVLDAIIKNGSFSGDNPLAEGPSQLGVTGYTAKEGMWYAMGADGKVSVSETQADGYRYAEKSGVYITRIDGTQASAAPLYVGDIIVKINGLHMNAITDVIGEVNRHYAGETVTVTVWRNGEYHDVQVRLKEGAIK